MPAKLTQKDYEIRIKEKYGEEYRVEGEYTGAHEHIAIRHHNCGFLFYPYAINFERGRAKCPICYKGQVQDQRSIEFKVLYMSKGYEVVGEYIGTNNTIPIRHKRCNYIFHPLTSSFLCGKSKCPICYKYQTQTNESLSYKLQIETNGEYSIVSNYVDARKKVTFRHNYNCNYASGSHIWLTTTDSFFNGGERCPCLRYKGQCIPEDFNITKHSGIMRAFTWNTEELVKRMKEINSNLEVTGQYVNINAPISVKCKVCGGEWDTATPANLLKGEGCPYCSHAKILKGFSDLSFTHQEVAKLLKDKDWGFTHFFYERTEKAIFICPRCGNEIRCFPFELFNSRGEINCGSCKDSISFPERYVYNFLRILSIPFRYQYTSKDAKWCGSYRYDFYVEESNTIIEVHGRQHYKNTTWGKKAEQEKKDIEKEKRALLNGIQHYIVIDAQVSDSNYIKKSIQGSLLPELYDLSNFDWDKCSNYSLTSLFFEICRKWDQSSSLIEDFSKEYGLSKSTIIHYLERGRSVGICSYEKEEYNKRMRRIVGIKTGCAIYAVEKDQLFVSLQDAKRKGFDVCYTCQNKNRVKYGSHWILFSNLTEELKEERNLEERLSLLYQAYILGQS